MTVFVQAILAPVFAMFLWAGHGNLTGSAPLDGPSDNVTAQTESLTMSSGNKDPSEQVQGSWKITRIGAMDVSADLGLTATFESGTGSFFSGCNTITAAPMFGPHDMFFNLIGGTKKLCESDVMDRERALIDAIGKAARMTVGPGELLSFFDRSHDVVLVVSRDSQ